MGGHKDGRNDALFCEKNCSSKEESVEKDSIMRLIRRSTSRTNRAKFRSMDLRQNVTTQPPAALFKYNTIHQEYFNVKCLDSKPSQWRKTSIAVLRSWKWFYGIVKLNTCLLDAVENGNVNEINRLLELHANPNATCRLTHVSVCHMAAMKDNEVLSLLIKANAKTIRTDKLGRTPLHLAAWAGNFKQIAILLGFPEELLKKITHRMTKEVLLEVMEHCAVKHDLLNMTCNIGFRPSWRQTWLDSIEHNCSQIKKNLKLPVFVPGWTALHSACARAHYTCVQLLLAAGANVCARDYIGRTPLDVVGIAYYSGDTIDVSRETIKILVEAGGDFYSTSYNRRSIENTPLHTAVEMESLETIRELLTAGAAATSLDATGLTVMHLCVKKQLREPLKVILEKSKHDENDPAPAIVDAVDDMGLTVLHYAVRTKWCDGVCLALGAGAQILTMANDGEFPIHSVATTGDTHILQELLAVAKDTIDHLNDKEETALFVAISNNHLEIVKMLIENGASIKVTLRDQRNVLHVAAQYGYEEILEYLLYYGGSPIANLINAWADYTPITYAVLYNYPSCVRLLLENGAVLESTIPFNDLFCMNDYDTHTTDLHIAAVKNHFEIAEIILDFDSEAINKPNYSGVLPLHVACIHKSREVIKLFIYKGADLSSIAPHIYMKPTAIELIINRLSKPVQLLEEIFDCCICIREESSLDDRECEVTVNYRILWPNSSDMKQMKVIKALANTGNRYDQRRLLLHPLIESFLHLKWKALLPFFYVIIALYALFVVSLNMYVVSVFYYHDKQNNGTDSAKLYNMTNLHSDVTPFILTTRMWKYLLYVSASLITLQEIIFMSIRNKRYFLSVETWVKFGSMAFSIFLPSMVSWYVLEMAADSEHSIEWPRLIATIALLFTWLELMFLLSRFPNWGFYVLMFAKVATKVLKILLTFMFLLIGFSLSFMIQLHAKSPFDTPWAAITKTFVMMTSEYDYGALVDQETEENNEATITASVIILRLIFIAFVILASIVLMNLMVGVAVNDVNSLEEVGNQMRSVKQVEFLASLEDIVLDKTIQQFLPEIFMSFWKQVHALIIFRPEKIQGFPIHLRDAIFEKAQRRRDQMDEDQGQLLRCPIKFNEVHDAIIQLKDKMKKSEEAIITINDNVDKFNKQIDDLRKEMMSQFKTVKQLVDKNCDCKK